LVNLEKILPRVVIFHKKARSYFTSVDSAEMVSVGPELVSSSERKGEQ
jgi:hypothetical protein